MRSSQSLLCDGRFFCCIAGGVPSARLLSQSPRACPVSYCRPAQRNIPAEPERGPHRAGKISRPMENLHLCGWSTFVLQPPPHTFAKPALRAPAAAFASAFCSFMGWVAHEISSFRFDKSSEMKISHGNRTGRIYYRKRSASIVRRYHIRGDILCFECGERFLKTIT